MQKVPAGSKQVGLRMKMTKGLLLDAFGTLVELKPPAPVLMRELRDGWGIELSPEAAGRALTAEITYYKAHQLDGYDAASLADLRLRSANVLRDSLPVQLRDRIDPAELLPAMMRSLQFRPFDDVVDALKRFRSDGLRLAVVSNWDVSLGEVLDRCGIGGLVDHVVSSAEVGATKPSPAVFEHALELLGLPASAVHHVGDEPELDVVGARAAGVAPILIRRDFDLGPGVTHRDPGLDPAVDPDVPVITTLDELPSI